MKLFTTNNPKLKKGEKLSNPVRTLVLHFLPYNLGGHGNLCGESSAWCRNLCINICGHGGMARKDGVNVCHNARQARTTLFATNFPAFKAQVIREIINHVAYCMKHGYRPAVRCNGTSDLPFFDILRDVIETFPQVSFYDYTKVRSYWLSWYAGNFPKNTHLTYSSSENKGALEFALNVVRLGHLAAVVVKLKPSQAIPETFLGLPTVDGDEHDYRPDDAKNGGALVILRAKGPARKAPISGFVLSPNATLQVERGHYVAMEV